MAQVTRSELATARELARSQEQFVLMYFRSRRRDLTPEDVLTVMPPRTPLTSVRRAITNLTTLGKLKKIPSQRRGRFGKPIHSWRLAK